MGYGLSLGKAKCGLSEPHKASLMVLGKTGSIFLIPLGGLLRSGDIMCSLPEPQNSVTPQLPQTLVGTFSRYGTLYLLHTLSYGTHLPISPCFSTVFFLCLTLLLPLSFNLRVHYCLGTLFPSSLSGLSGKKKKGAEWWSSAHWMVISRQEEKSNRDYSFVTKAKILINFPILTYL